MNQSATKFERRDMKRVIGTAGLQAIEQHADLLEQILPSLEAFQAIAKDTDRRLTELEAWRNRSFRERLKWVLLGE